MDIKTSFEYEGDRVYFIIQVNITLHAYATKIGVYDITRGYVTKATG
jgi:hypothetical protein